MCVGNLGIVVGLGIATPHIKRRSIMDVIENIALIVFLIAIGVSATFAVLLGMFYMFEVLND
jgi:hypothetical protein